MVLGEKREMDDIQKGEKDKEMTGYGGEEGERV